MIDGMKSSKLREKSSIGNIISDIFPAIDAFCPVVSPIVHTSRFESVRPHIINVSARPFIGHGPIRKGFHKFRFLSFHQLPAFLFFGGKFLVIFKQFASFVNISPTLKNREITTFNLCFDTFILTSILFQFLHLNIWIDAWPENSHLREWISNLLSIHNDFVFWPPKVA